MADEDNIKSTNETENVDKDNQEECIPTQSIEIDQGEDCDEIDFTDWDEIFGDISLEDIVPSDEKEEINSSKDFINEEKNSYIRFDKEFHKFLQNFVEIQDKKDRQKIEFKEIFFFTVMFGFLIIMVTPFALVLKMSDLDQITAIVSLITVLIELVSAIKILPQIIAEYLFNKEEDAKLLQIIETMQKYNKEKHDYINDFAKHNKNNV